MTVRGIERVARKRNPFAAVSDIRLTVGAEAALGANIINVAGKAYGVAGRTMLQGWFSKDANGDTPLRGIFMPESYAGGVNGTLYPGPLDADRIYPTPFILAVDAAPEKFKLITNTATFFVGGSAFTKAPTTANTFTAAHVVALAKFGIILVQVTQAGVVSTKVPAATPTTAMTYTTAALAKAALPSPDALNVAVGYILIDALTATAWTANTDDMTAASDVDTATFVSAPANGPYPTTFDILTESDGTFDVAITDTRVTTGIYLNVKHPDGLKVTSSVIAHA